eukprot:2323030-Rhodomonas_salina.1
MFLRTRWLFASGPGLGLCRCLGLCPGGGCLWLELALALDLLHLRGQHLPDVASQRLHALLVPLPLPLQRLDLLLRLPPPHRHALPQSRPPHTAHCMPHATRHSHATRIASEHPRTHIGTPTGYTDGRRRRHRETESETETETETDLGAERLPLRGARELRLGLRQLLPQPAAHIFHVAQLREEALQQRLLRLLLHHQLLLVLLRRLQRRL